MLLQLNMHGIINILDYRSINGHRKTIVTEDRIVELLS